MVVPTFVGQALAGQAITVFGEGTQSRCFCHVDDVARALIDLMSREDAYGEVFNIGSAEEISVWDLAERVRAAADSQSEIVTVPYEEGFEDVARRVPDIAKLHRLSGWAPTLSLREVLEDVVEHQRAGSSTDAGLIEVA
ncbi:MAG: GDP-mannose 4,6-dehydratase [Actinomycetota bacterium]|nr:GDP-mannose 4,6-dehydratase [Actinomycetota bacterium]